MTDIRHLKAKYRASSGNARKKLRVLIVEKQIELEDRHSHRIGQFNCSSGGRIVKMRMSNDARETEILTRYSKTLQV